MRNRDFDRHVQRTKERPVTTAHRAARGAVGATSLALAAFVLILPLNRLTLLLSIPAVFLAASYPYTKRFMSIPQAYWASRSASASRWRSPATG